MVQISKKQMEFIKSIAPDTVFTVLNKQATNSAKRKTRFVEGTTTVKKLLKRFSEEVEIVKETYGIVD